VIFVRSNASIVLANSAECSAASMWVRLYKGSLSVEAYAATWVCRRDGQRLARAILDRYWCLHG
jgi:hypothetical protein